MRVKAAVLLVALLGATAPASAQQPAAGSAPWVVQRYFVDHAFPHRAAYLTSELAEHPEAPSVGSGLPVGAHAAYRVLTMDSTHAVYAVTLSDSTHSEDLYAFLYPAGPHWQLGEIRALALPGLFYRLLDSLRKTPVLPDSMRNAYDEMQLTVASDSALKSYFTAHRAALEQLARAGSGEPDHGPGVIARRLPADSEHPGCVFLVIGGMTDNSVGYLFAPPACTVPAMSPGEFIYVDQLAPHWYLYKTT
jgi:hypothetical protein